MSKQQIITGILGLFSAWVLRAAKHTVSRSECDAFVEEITAALHGKVSELYE